MSMGNTLWVKKRDRTRFELLPEVQGLDQILATLLAMLALGFGWRLSFSGHPKWGLALLILSWVRLIPVRRARRFL